jgi:hypothetical protein
MTALQLDSETMSKPICKVRSSPIVRHVECLVEEDEIYLVISEGLLGNFEPACHLMTKTHKQHRL